MTSVTPETWLINTVLGASVALICGYAAMCLNRHPASRKAIGAWTLLACLLIGIATAIPGLPRWHLSGLAVSVKPDLDLGTLRSDPAKAQPIQAIDHAGAQDRNPLIPVQTGIAVWQWTLRLYWVIATALALRLLCGVVLAARLVRSAKLPPPHVRACWLRIRTTKYAQVRVCQSLPRPVTTGVLRMTVLIPPFLCVPTQTEELEAILSHEAAHVCSRDTALLLLAGIVRIFLFAHPLYWLVWRDLRLSQELLADAWAARRIGSAAGYAERLIRVAHNTRPLVEWLIPVLQAIRRRSEFYQRMEHLLKHGDQTRPAASLPFWSIVGLCMLLLAATASMVTTQASPRPPRPLNAMAPAEYSGRSISKSERKGLAYLVATQEPNGTWLSQSGPGVTALVVRALVQGGYDPDLGEVQRALRWIKSTRKPDGGYYLNGQPTYNTAIVISTLATLPGHAYDQPIEQGRQFLLAMQRPQPAQNSFYAGFSDHFTPPPDRLPEADAISDALRPQRGTSDNSLFIHSPGERSDDAAISRYGALTYMQLKSLLYAGLTRDDPRVRFLLAAVQANFTLTTNPIYDAPQGQYYFYYVLSKALRACGDDRLTDSRGVTHIWRTELAARLTELQAADGSWINHQSNYWLEDNPILVTTYGVLALQESRR